MKHTRIFTRILCALVLIVGILASPGCDKDRKKGGGSKPPPSDTQKVPDAPSGLKLTGIAVVALVAAKLAHDRFHRPT